MPRYRGCSDVLYWRLDGYLLLLLMECLLFQKVDLAFAHWKDQSKGSHQELNVIFNQRACLSKGMRPLGRIGRGLNGNTIDEKTSRRSLKELMLYSHPAEDQSRIAPAITSNA